MTGNPATDPEIARLEILKLIPPLLPTFLTKRRAGLPAVEELMEELGIERPELFTLIHLNILQGSYDGPVTPAQIRADDPYSTIDQETPILEALVEKGLVGRDNNGCYSLAARAKGAIARLHDAGRAHVGRLRPLPDEELEELARQLERAVQGILSDSALSPRPGSHLAGRLSLATFVEGAPAMVRIEQAVTSLWGARDDAHIRAWREAGCEGPSVAVLTRIWYGEAHTLNDLQKVLEYQQTPTDVESSVAYLVEKDYVARDGDDVLTLTPEGALVREDIERETDRIYFGSWPQTVGEARWTCERLTALVDDLSISVVQ